MEEQHGGLAQLAARMLSMHKVAGSIPAISNELSFSRGRTSKQYFFVQQPQTARRDGTALSSRLMQSTVAYR